MKPLAQQEGNSLRLDVIFLNTNIPVVSGTTQVLVSLTTDMQADNITALYTQRPGNTTTHAPDNKGETNTTISDNKGARTNTYQIKS